MYCLDTDLVIAFLRGDDRAKEKLDALRKINSIIAVTIVTLRELYKGAYLSMRKEENIALINIFLKNVTILIEDGKSCMIFGNDFAMLKLKGAPTHEPDLVIGSICKANGYTL